MRNKLSHCSGLKWLAKYVFSLFYKPLEGFASTVILIISISMLYVWGTMLVSAYRKHEQEKCRAYEERVREMEHGCFTPLVFLTSGGMGKAATIVYKRLTNLLSIQRNIPYPTLMGWLRCTLNFSLLKSSIMCIHRSIPLWTPSISCLLSPGHPLYPLISLLCLIIM